MSELEPPEEDTDNELTSDKDEDDGASEENKSRANFFFAVLSFLLALICLSIFINNHYDLASGWALLLGIILFGGAGILFLRQKPKGSVLMATEIEEAEVTNVADEVEEGEEVVEETGEESLTAFKLLVEQALSSIPPEFQEMMENLVILVESEPSEEVLERMHVEEGHTLFGLYEGAPLTAWGRGGARLPERITIFQHPIEKYCRKDPDRIREQVRRTVLHEVAHHFGIDHEEMPIWIQ